MASAKKQPSGRVHAKVGRGASVAGGNQPSGGAKDGRGTSLATKKNIPSAVKANTGAKEAISSYKKAELKGLIAEMSDHITQLNSDLTTLKTKFNEL